MTIQAFRLLRKLKKAQMNIGEYVYIDHDELTASTFHETGKPFKTVKLKGYRISLNSTLRYLHEEKYIEYDTVYNAVQVLHSGWYLGQTMMSNFIKFLINSIAVPIIVSLVTTLATLFIQSLFAR